MKVFRSIVFFLFCACAFSNNNTIKQQFSNDFSGRNFDLDDLDEFRVAAVKDEFVVIYKFEKDSFYLLEGQFYSKLGEKRGDPFVFRNSTYDIEDPEVTSSQGDSFLVAWEESIDIRENSDIVGQLISTTSGETIGEPLRINDQNSSYFDSNQGDPVPAKLNDDKGYVIVWEGDSDNDNVVFGRIYDVDGNAITNEFQINTYNVSSQDDCAVVVLQNGNFVAVWESGYQDGSDDGVYGQIVSPLGEKIGSEIKLHTNTTNSQDDPEIAALNNGGFVVVWESKHDKLLGEGYGQIFNKLGERVGEQFRINNNTIDPQFDFLPIQVFGGFFVVWEDRNTNGNGNGLIRGQYFDNNGDRIGDEFLLTNGTYHSANPRVCTLQSTNEVVVVWEINDNGYGGVILANNNECFKECSGENEYFNEESCSCMTKEDTFSSNIWIPITIASISIFILLVVVIVIVLLVVLLVLYFGAKKSPKDPKDAELEGL